MKYKAGDKVIVKKGLEVNSKYGCTLLPKMYDALKDMDIATIIYADSLMEAYIIENGGIFHYSDEMFEGLVDESKSNQKLNRSMKTDPNDPINPITHECYPSRIESVIDKDGLATGLTKREYFAAMAMQGLLANPYFSNPVPYSVEYADALIKELNK